MVVKGRIKSSEYFDSVTLMIAAQKINDFDGVHDAAVVMGTEENKSILASSGLMIPEFEHAKGSDLLICIKAKNSTIIDQAFQQVDDILLSVRRKQDDEEVFNPRSLKSALDMVPDANLVLISIAGMYAVKEAKKALEKNLNVMIFSDNVPIEDEIQLKKIAQKKGLFVMGPDCGTAIINGIPLAFANVVNKGNIGIVAASGTGLQEISSIISNNGAGISQAIGTGGRDVKEDVDGIMFLQSIEALNNDEHTEILVLVSKPPSDKVLQKIINKVKDVSKPVVAVFLGSDGEYSANSTIYFSKTLEEAALTAVSLSKKENAESNRIRIEERKKKLMELAHEIAAHIDTQQKYIRGLFCGGTLCEEAQFILKPIIGEVNSNITSDKKCRLNDPWESSKNTIIDMGADVFTVGRPHPMIDYSLRNRRILKEAQDPEVAVIQLDVVLGYGSNMKPAEELVPVIEKAQTLAKTARRQVVFICSITGTVQDPQNKNEVSDRLKTVGVYVMESNAAASELSGYVIKILAEKTTEGA